MKRRDVLKCLVTIPFTSVATRLYAAPTTSARILMVFLRGGYDAANLLVPVSSAFYYESRPNIAIPKDAALPIDADWALHPALAESLHALYTKGEAALIPFAGTEDLSRSHFETQDSIELGQPLDGPHDLRSGFMARLAAELADARPIAFTDSLPLTFRGSSDVPNVSLKSAGKPAFDE